LFEQKHAKVAKAAAATCPQCFARLHRYACPQRFA
jgi:hypothetical protein